MSGNWNKLFAYTQPANSATKAKINRSDSSHHTASLSIDNEQPYHEAREKLFLLDILFPQTKVGPSDIQKSLGMDQAQRFVFEGAARLVYPAQSRTLYGRKCSIGRE
jgi:hypothetical protein